MEELHCFLSKEPDVVKLLTYFRVLGRVTAVLYSFTELQQFRQQSRGYWMTFLTLMFHCEGEDSLDNFITFEYACQHALLWSTFQGKQSGR